MNEAPWAGEERGRGGEDEGGGNERGERGGDALERSGSGYGNKEGDKCKPQVRAEERRT